MSYKFIGCVPVNLGNWKTSDPKAGHDRGKEWREVYFHEATFNWGWLPPNSYGKFSMEMKNMNRESGFKGDTIEYQLAWVKRPSINKVTGEHFTHLKGAYFKENAFKPWELYESDYFPLPTYDGPILLYLMVRGEPETKPSVAMWTLALFEETTGEDPTPIRVEDPDVVLVTKDHVEIKPIRSSKTVKKTMRTLMTDWRSWRERLDTNNEKAVLSISISEIERIFDIEEEE